MLYQTFSGSLPCKADLMTSLMYNITSKEVANFRAICAGILQAQAVIINKAVLNDIAPGYRGGTSFTAALKDLLKT